MIFFAQARQPERRMQARRRADLDGRYMLSNRREYRCTVVNVSDGGLALVGPEKGRLGEKVIVYVDGLGRVAGEVIRHTDRGLALKLVGSSRAGEATGKLVRR